MEVPPPLPPGKIPFRNILYIQSIPYRSIVISDLKSGKEITILQKLRDCHLITQFLVGRGFHGGGGGGGQWHSPHIMGINGNALKQYIFAICENDMHQNKNLGISPAAPTYHTIHRKCLLLYQINQI